MFTDALEEFRSDWVLAGKAASSVDCYLRLLNDFAALTSEASLDDARGWVSAHPSPSMRRKRAQALIVNVSQRSVNRSKHVGERDLRRRA